MPTAIGNDFDDDLDFREALPYKELPHTHINKLQTAEAGSARKIHEMDPLNVILSAPTGTEKSLVGRATLGMPVSPTATERLHEAEEYLEQLQNTKEMPSDPRAFPNLAWESVMLGLARENHLNRKLNEHVDAIQEMQNNISLLLNLSTEISGLKEEEEAKLPEKAQQILEQLEARGIKLRKEGQTIEELKRQGSSRESGLRSEIEIRFTTQVQRAMGQIQAIIEILQHIIRSNEKLEERANQLPR